MRARGQALVELAIFGAFVIMLLGTLINYGLNYDYQQQARMAAFREGLRSAGADLHNLDAPVSRSQLLIQDRHIPNPADPFGVGPVVPATSQAGVTRSYGLLSVPDQEYPGDTRTLPKLVLQIANEPPREYTLAGFRPETVPQSSLERYKFVYGDANICDQEECGGGNAGCIAEETEELDPVSGLPVTRCVEYRKLVVITDQCDGQIVNYDDCLAQAAQMTDAAACEAACQKQAALGTEGLDCARICSLPMGFPPPWYAAERALDNLFATSRTLGVQPGDTRVTRRALRLDKSERAGGITATGSGSWSEEITRTISTHQEDGARDDQPITTIKSGGTIP